MLGHRFVDSLFPVKTIDQFIDRRHLFGRRVTLEGLIRGLIRQLLFSFLHVGISIKNNSGTTFMGWEDGDALVSFEVGLPPPPPLEIITLTGTEQYKQMSLDVKLVKTWEVELRSC